MTKFIDIRVNSQQLDKPCYNSSLELVSWMGAVQAQDYNMSKWAVSTRLKSANMLDIEESLKQGKILRTHILRPTWHLISSQDIRWMLKLSAQRIISANKSIGKHLDISISMHKKCSQLIEKSLEGNQHKTKQELKERLRQAGIDIDSSVLNRIMVHAEAEGIVCSGIDKGRKPTYALLDERVAPTKELHKEEALATLAIRYFQSHSPASLTDFSWWSGLSLTESRHAIHLIKEHLISETIDSQEFFISENTTKVARVNNTVHLLPSYDEYLISYKDRTAVLDIEHYPKAFNNFGIFYPVIMFNGKIVGNWTKSIKKKEILIETSFFTSDHGIEKDLLESAQKRYLSFIAPK